MTKQDAVPPKIRRQALATLSRDRLSSLTDHFELDVGDRRALDQHVDALVRARAAPRAHRRTRSARDVAADLKWTKKVVAAEAPASPVAAAEAPVAPAPDAVKQVEAEKAEGEAPTAAR